MNRLESAIRLLFCLPPVWVAMLAIGAAAATEGWEPLIDVLAYAIQRLFG